MKKIKYIALALVLMLALVGGAYAAWTDTIVLGGDIDTGELSIKFEGAAGSNGIYEELKYDLSDKKLTVNVDKLFPREPDDGNLYATITTHFINNGSIPAKVTKVTVKSPQTFINEYLRFSYYDGQNSQKELNLEKLEDVFNDVLGDEILDKNDTFKFSLEFWLAADTPDWVMDKQGSYSIEFEFGQFNF